MSNLAAIAEQTGNELLLALDNPFEDAFSDVSKGSWLPRLQLEGSNSTLVKMDRIAKGNYALHTGKDEFTDLGSSVDCLVLGYRPKALDLSDPKKPVSSYNHTSETYLAIKADADSKDTQRKKGKMYGMEFLLYLPDGPEGKKYATLHMGSPTSRRETNNFRPLIKKAATLTCAKIKTDQYVWEAIRVNPSSREIAIDDGNEMMSIYRDFINVPADSKPKEDSQPIEVEQRG